MFYEINKSTGNIEFIESSVLMVPEFKELVTYFKHKNFPKLGWFYMSMVVLIASPRSPFNKSTWEKEEIYKKVMKAAYALLMSELPQLRPVKPPVPELKFLMMPVFQNALKEFEELENDNVFNEYCALDKQYNNYSKALKNIDLTDKENKGPEKAKVLMSVGKTIREDYESCKKILFEKLKNQDKKVDGKGITSNKIFQKS